VWVILQHGFGFAFGEIEVRLARFRRIDCDIALKLLSGDANKNTGIRKTDADEPESLAPPSLITTNKARGSCFLERSSGPVYRNGVSLKVI